MPFAAAVLWNPLYAIGAYLALGLVVLASRLLFPAMKAKAAASDTTLANDQIELAKAA